MAGMHSRAIIILFCHCAIFAAMGFLLWLQYFDPYASDPPEKRSKRRKLQAYVILGTLLIAYAVMAIARWAK